MWMESDSVYFKRRARQEREAAYKAVHPVAREAHLAMAERFKSVSEAIAATDRRRRPGQRLLARYGGTYDICPR